MKSTIAIVVVAGIAVLANIGTIVDNACKYFVVCTQETETAKPAKPEIVVVHCNGRSIKLANGTVICEPNKPLSSSEPDRRALLQTRGLTYRSIADEIFRRHETAF